MRYAGVSQGPVDRRKRRGSECQGGSLRGRGQDNGTTAAPHPGYRSQCTGPGHPGSFSLSAAGVRDRHSIPQPRCRRTGRPGGVGTGGRGARPRMLPRPRYPPAAPKPRPLQRCLPGQNRAQKFLRPLLPPSLARRAGSRRIAPGERARPGCGQAARAGGQARPPHPPPPWARAPPSPSRCICLPQL